MVERYEESSYDALLGAVRLADENARSALAEFFRVRSTGRVPVVERHPQFGRRIRNPVNVQPLDSEGY